MTDPTAEHARAVRELARADGRTLMGDGIEWRVYELPPGVYDRRGTASLVFESSDAFRRVRAFPPEWRTLSDADLYRVSFSALRDRSGGKASGEAPRTDVVRNRVDRLSRPGDRSRRASDLD